MPPYFKLIAFASLSFESLLIDETAITVCFDCIDKSKLYPNCSNSDVPVKVISGIAEGYLYK